MTTRYEGDDSTARMLAEQGVALGAAAVRALVAGVAAAPPTRPARAWQVLVHPDASPELAAQLDLLRDSLATAPANGPQGADRLTALRAELRARELDGFLVPRADRHQGEYVPQRAERLQWLTGFSGSAGVAAVLLDSGVMFVDGRYSLQAKAQVDTDAFELQDLIENPPHKWLRKNLPEGARLGYDPWLHTVDGAKKLREACEKAGATLVAVDTNPLDAVWTDQPPAPISPVRAHPTEHAGRTALDKRTSLGEALAADGVDAAVLTMPDSIAWLLNIRGGDVPRTPLPLSFAVLAADGTVDLCIDERKLAPGTREHLGDDVRLHDMEALGDLLDALGGAGKTVQVAKQTGADTIATRLEASGADVSLGDDPCALPKAKKNEVELEGVRRAHRRDGAALTRFLAWLDRVGPTGRVTEQEASDHLHRLREETGELRDLSFDTISGAGPNGAIVHYRVTPDSNRAIEPDSLYLVDSGGQYPDGTTDVTRTIAIGEPTAEMRERFTLVLLGHISLGTARFAKGTTGEQLDVLARLPLWQAGLDYDHGTGHGVGSYLSVHEGPHRISKAHNTVPLEPGMIVSNEPGFYKEGAYGIRIENLVAVTPPAAVDGGEREMLGFETLTLAPIDRRLVNPSLMSAVELAWLNAYHARVREELTPLLDGEDLAWLGAATAPIGTTA